MISPRELPRWFWYSIPVTLALVAAGIWIPLLREGYRPFMQLQQTQGVLKERVLGRCPGSRGPISYQVQLRYTYQVGGRAYTGQRLGVQDGCEDYDDLQEATRDLVIDAPVTVHYSPLAPSFAVLSKKTSLAGKVLLYAAAFQLLIFVAWYRWRQARD